MKKAFTVFGVLVAICMFFVYRDIQVANADWDVEYKRFQVTKHTSVDMNHISKLFTRNYYWSLEDESGFKTNISVSEDLFDFIENKTWITCSLLNKDGGKSSKYAIILYKINLEDYTREVLWILYRNYSHVEL